MGPDSVVETVIQISWKMLLQPSQNLTNSHFYPTLVNSPVLKHCGQSGATITPLQALGDAASHTKMGQVEGVSKCCEPSLRL